jgi:two-component system sensor histidine kinase DesK
VLQADDHALALTIQDDGRAGLLREGNGLAGMRERVEAAGGRLVVQGAGGVTIRVEFPLASNEVA